MRFQLIKSKLRPPVVNGDAYTQDIEEFLDEIKDFRKEADLVVAFDENGNENLSTRLNFNLGTCDCCGLRDHRDMVRFDFYKRVEDES